MPHMTPDNTFVVICDWHGNLVWKSTDLIETEVGEQAWSHIHEDDVDEAKQAFAHTVTFQENQVVEVRSQKGDFFRIWLWPLKAPDSAACVLTMRIPEELASLSPREKECLMLLAEGRSTKQIAAELDISLSTAQTHLKRSREKLNLKTAEALVGFAARYCHHDAGPFEK